jgi:hypothetical protein
MADQVIGTPGGVSGNINTTDLGNMSHADLYRMRDQADGNQNAQNTLAPAEHQAFAREWTESNPVLAPISLALAIPAYTAAKALGLTGTDGMTSKPSLDEMMAGYKGIGQGLKNVWSRTIN